MAPLQPEELSWAECDPRPVLMLGQGDAGIWAEVPSREGKGLPGGKEGGMQQPRKAEHLWSPLLLTLTPGSGLAKLARDWGHLSWESQPPQSPRTGMRLLLHSSSSPRGATGDGEGSAGAA